MERRQLKDEVLREYERRKSEKKKDYALNSCSNNNCKPVKRERKLCANCEREWTKTREKCEANFHSDKNETDRERRWQQAKNRKKKRRK